MSRQDDLTGFDAAHVTVPPGITNAVLVQDPAYVVGGAIKYESGGTLLIMRAPGLDQSTSSYGATLTGAQLLAGYSAGKFWKVDAGTPVNYNGAGRYYLAAVGSTSICAQLRGLSAGYIEAP